MINLGWGNDPEVWQHVKELEAQGEVFHCTRPDKYGKDDVYESESGKYMYHICTE